MKIIFQKKLDLLGLFRYTSSQLNNVWGTGMSKKVNDMNNFTVNLMYTRFDDGDDGSLITRYSRIEGLDKYPNITDAQNAGREYYAEHPEVAPEGSERHLCILDDFGRLVSYVTKTIEHGVIEF